jgi:hypothetical protein
MAACAWSMEPAFAVVVPARCASSASGMATPLQSRARKAGCYIRSRWALPRCGYALLPPQRTSARLHRPGAPSTGRGDTATGHAGPATPSERSSVPCAAYSFSPLVERKAGAQCPDLDHGPTQHQALRSSRTLRHLPRSANGVKLNSLRMLSSRTDSSSPKGASWPFFLISPLFLPSCCSFRSTFRRFCWLTGSQHPTRLRFRFQAMAQSPSSSLRNAWDFPSYLFMRLLWKIVSSEGLPPERNKLTCGDTTRFSRWP